jgi:hypothetical protein
LAQFDRETVARDGGEWRAGAPRGRCHWGRSLPMRHDLAVDRDVVQKLPAEGRVADTGGALLNNGIRLIEHCPSPFIPSRPQHHIAIPPQQRWVFDPVACEFSQLGYDRLN